MTTIESPFKCECENDDGSEPTRVLYRVTFHDGETALAHYCDECAGLARADWNGETASIEEVTP